MSVESLTYADLADRLGTTQEAARSLVRRLRLPRQTGNDGKVRINIDLAEIQYKPQPARSPSGHQPDIETLKAQIAGLQDELKNLEAENSMIRSSAAGHRADFERERDRYDSLMVEVLKQTASWLCRNALPEVSKRSSFGRVALRSLFSGLARPSSRP